MSPRRPAGIAVPVAVRAAVERAWRRRLRRPARIVEARAVRGGSISPCARVETEAGDVAFLKWGSGDVGRRMFIQEAHALGALRHAGALRAPEVIARVQDPGGEDADPDAEVAPRPPAGPDAEAPAEPAAPAHTDAGAEPDAETPAEPDDYGWILLEWLQPGRASRAAWRSLGSGLARLHRVRDAAFGWSADNYIGSLPQSNARRDDWPAFWREHRLEPQLRRARDAGLLDDTLAARFHTLLHTLDDRLAIAAEEGASLLHGDLWSGNIHMLGGGAAAVIDPASYYGHREADLAMTELFGGFDPAFYAAYEEAWPLDADYRGGRRAIYQLYYLLVHVNLFGAGYLSSTAAALARAGA